jgi:hypothetical protein
MRLRLAALRPNSALVRRLLGSAHMAGESRASWLALLTVAACAVTLRFYGIAHLPGINGDEPQYAVHARSFLDGAPLSSLRTGSNLPQNPLFFGVVTLLQALFPPTLRVLRMAAVIESLLALTLAWALFRARGALLAATFALLVAALPIHLGYARFAWDTCAMPCASVLALAAATRRRAILTGLAFMLCLWVHPTSVFSLPMLLAPFMSRWPRDERGRIDWRDPRLLGLMVMLLAACGAAIFAIAFPDVLPSAVQGVLNGERVTKALERAASPLEFADFAAGYVHLLSGVTIYSYITGALTVTAASVHLAVGLALILPVLVLGLRQLYRNQRWIDLSIAVGLGLTLLSAYIVAGPVILAPKTERYAMFLTVPGCYVLAACLDVLATTLTRANAVRWFTSTVAGAMLAAFCVFYLAALHRPGPQREDTFRTGEVDPKRRALKEVLQMRDPQLTTMICAEDWWIYWTIRYLAPPATGVRVTIYKHKLDYRFPSDFVWPKFNPTSMELFGVAWAGHQVDSTFAQRATRKVEVFGYEPGPLLRVYRLPPMKACGRRK